MTIDKISYRCEIKLSRNYNSAAIAVEIGATLEPGEDAAKVRKTIAKKVKEQVWADAEATLDAVHAATQEALKSRIARMEEEEAKRPYKYGLFR